MWILTEVVLIMGVPIGLGWNCARDRPTALAVWAAYCFHFHMTSKTVSVARIISRLDSGRGFLVLLCRMTAQKHKQSAMQVLLCYTKLQIAFPLFYRCRIGEKLGGSRPETGAIRSSEGIVLVCLNRLLQSVEPLCTRFNSLNN